jgi:hypothetical protein
MMIVQPPARHSGTAPTGPRNARPDGRLRAGPGIQNRDGRAYVWIPGSRALRAPRNDAERIAL